MRDRPFIRTPNGRTFYGRRPQSLGMNGEAPYIAKLAEQVQGLAEVVLPCGRADVATETHVFEVEPVASWRHGAQQAFAYSAMTGCIPVIAIFGHADYEAIYLRVRDKILAGLELWGYDGERWHELSGRAKASRIRPQIERLDRHARLQADEERRYREAPMLWAQDQKLRRLARAVTQYSLRQYLALDSAAEDRAIEAGRKLARGDRF